MTIDEALDQLSHACGSLDLYWGKKADEALQAIRDHIAAQPRTMLGKDVPDELLGRRWHIVGTHVVAELSRSFGETKANQCNGCTRFVMNSEVYGPLPEVNHAR